MPCRTPSSSNGYHEDMLRGKEQTDSSTKAAMKTQHDCSRWRRLGQGVAAAASGAVRPGSHTGTHQTACRPRSR